MNATPPQDHDHSSYEPVFSYGHLRAHYLQSDMGSGSVHIRQFVRAEHLATLREHLLADRATLTTTPNTLLQVSLSAISCQCLWELQSGIMLRVLENISGLFNLLPDTHCKQTSLLLPPVTHAGIGQWHDPNTRLAAALVLVINLDNGDADLCVNADALSRVTTGSTSSLQVTYWQHYGDTAGVSA